MLDREWKEGGKKSRFRKRKVSKEGNREGKGKVGKQNKGQDEDV